jgi:hypothetical protein
MREGQWWKVQGDTVRALWFTSIGQSVDGYLTEGEYRIGTRQDVCGRGIGVSLIGKGTGHIYYVAESSIPGGLVA